MIKLREALIETQATIAKCMDILNKIPDECGYGGLLDDVADELCDLRESHLKDALAAPRRNCDRFETAEEAWDAYDEWVESCRAKGQTPAFNEFGWLFAAAAEKEGGAK
jgi:hypothetical protein